MNAMAEMDMKTLIECGRAFTPKRDDRGLIQTVWVQSQVKLTKQNKDAIYHTSANSFKVLLVFFALKLFWGSCAAWPH